MSILGLVCKHLEDPEVTLTGERNSAESECKRKSERKLQSLRLRKTEEAKRSNKF